MAATLGRRLRRRRQGPLDTPFPRRHADRVTRSGRFSLLQKVAALAPIALLLACLPGEAYLRCRIDGSVRAACCCADGLAPANPGPIARAQDCCDRETTAGARPLVEAPRPALGDGAVLAPLRLPVPFALLAPAAPRVDRSRRAHGPPRGGPRIVLLKQAFLI